MLFNFIYLRYSLFALLFTAFVFAKAEEDGLAYLNTLRQHTGLIALHRNALLSKAAYAHAMYLIAHQQTGHYENKYQRYYTGKTPAQRVLKAGYGSAVVMENVSTNTLCDISSIDTLFSAIYHRFVFLDFDKNDIGIGVATSKKKKGVTKAYVYDLGTSGLVKLCKHDYRLKNGMYYIKGVCNNAQKMIPQAIFDKEISLIGLQNSKMVRYPYDGQKEVPPAFYDESPDPLPKYDVSGFPVSVSFNPNFVSEVKFKSFRLYDEEGYEIRKTKILQKKSDPNHRLSRFEFALMPLARLEFSHTYKAVFEAEVDGENVYTSWRFTTQTFREKLYRVSKNHATLTVNAGESIVLYMAPNHRKDLLKNYRLQGKAKATFLDQNTLKIDFPKSSSVSKVILLFGDKREVTFKVEASL